MWTPSNRPFYYNLHIINTITSIFCTLSIGYNCTAICELLSFFYVYCLRCTVCTAVDVCVWVCVCVCRQFMSQCTVCTAVDVCVCVCVCVCRQFMPQCTVCTTVASRLFYSYNLMKSIAVSLHCTVTVLLKTAAVYWLLNYIVKYFNSQSALCQAVYGKR